MRGDDEPNEVEFDFFRDGTDGDEVRFGAGRGAGRPTRRRRPIVLGVAIAATALIGLGLSARDDPPAAAPATSTSTPTVPTTDAGATGIGLPTTPATYPEEPTVVREITVGGSELAAESFPWTVYLRSEGDVAGFRVSLAPLAFIPLDQAPMGVLTVGDATIVLDANDLGALTTYLGPNGAVWTSWSNLYLRLSFGAGGLSGVVEQVAPLDVFGVPGLAPLVGTSAEGRPVIAAPDGAVFAVQRDESMAAVAGAPGMENGVFATLACDETGGCFSQIGTAGAKPVQVPGFISRIDAAPDGTRVACWTEGAVYLADLRTWRVELLDDADPLPPPDDVHGGIGWSPDSRWFVYAAAGDVIKIVDTVQIADADSPSARFQIGVGEAMAVAGVGAEVG